MTDKPVNGAPALNVLRDQERVVTNMTQLCSLLVQAIRMAEGALAEIEACADQNRGVVTPVGVVVPMREAVQQIAAAYRRDLTAVLLRVGAGTKPH